MKGNIMVPQTGDAYLMTAEGEYIAWSLAVPVDYADWSVVSVNTVRSAPQQPLRLTVVPLRALSGEEVSLIKNRPLLLWGMKVPGYPWALVMCRQGAFSSSEVSYTDNTGNARYAIGV